MGTDKGLMLHRGKPMVLHLIELLQTFEMPVILVANNPDYQKFGLKVVEDEYPEIGPLGGLHAGLKASASDINIVLACDTPHITPELIRYLIDEVPDKEAVVPELNGRLHPLTAVYRKTALPAIKQQIDQEQYRLRDLLTLINSRILDLTGHPHFGNEYLFANINTPEEAGKWEVTVHTRYFGMIAEQLDKTEENIPLEAFRSEVDLRNFFEQRYPVLSSMSYLIAVDQELAETLNPDQKPAEIALLPPFAGG